MTLVYIHGATADRTTWNYLQSYLDHPNPVFFEYDSHETFKHNLVEMRDRLLDISGKINIVAHSLGGLYAAHLVDSHRDKINAVVSMSTPFNGSEVAPWIKLAVPGHPLFEDIVPSAWPVAHSRRVKITVPWTQIVTLGGYVPWLVTRNDGVVTHRSMTSRDDVEYVEVDCNHYDVVEAPHVAELVAHKLALI